MCIRDSIPIAQLSFLNAREGWTNKEVVYGVVTSNSLGSRISWFDYDHDDEMTSHY